MKRLICFDFDKTLCLTPEPKEGKVIFKNVTGIEWPYSGWWGRKETLDLNIFQIPVNEYVYKKYLEHISDENAYVFLATGRLEKMKSQVEKVLEKNNLSFKEVHCNPGIDTYVFKTRLFESLIKKHKPDLFVMYDDRYEHIVKFKEWAKTQNCQIDIIDIVNKKTTSIKNK